MSPVGSDLQMSMPRIWQAINHMVVRRSVLPAYFRLLNQNGVQERAMDLDFSIVADEPKPAEFIHEEANPRSGRADHFSKRFLTDLDANGLRAGFLAEICQQTQK